MENVTHISWAFNTIQGISCHWKDKIKTKAKNKKNYNNVLMNIIQASLNNLNLFLITFKERKKTHVNIYNNIVNYQE